MGRSRKPSAKRADSDSDSDHPSNSVLFLSSTDDEEANKDLSLEIVERAMAKDAKRNGEKNSEVVLVNSAYTGNLELNDESSKEKKSKKKIKREKKSEKKTEDEIIEDTDAEVPKEEEQVGTSDSVTEVNEVPVQNNGIIRKLLRWPRYFDPYQNDSIACFNCGEEGHLAADCTMEKKKRPCFVCGLFGHSSKHCTQGKDCYICKKRGHIAKKCPDKYTTFPQDSILCLRCGDLGHEMLSCKNDHPSSDLKEIQCYICKNYGHFCCVDIKDDGPKEVFCYNCAQPGHTGLGCAKVRSEHGDLVDIGPSDVCYKCGEEGHFARGCTKKTKSERRNGGSATASKTYKEDKRKKSVGSQSAPRDYGKVRKKKERFEYDDRWNTTSGKSRVKGGWIVDDPDDFPRSRKRSDGWDSPFTPDARRSHKVFEGDSNGVYSTPRSPFSKRKAFAGTPNSSASRYGNQHYNYTPRSYYDSHDYRW